MKKIYRWIIRKFRKRRCWKCGSKLIYAEIIYHDALRTSGDCVVCKDCYKTTVETKDFQDSKSCMGVKEVKNIIVLTKI